MFMGMGRARGDTTLIIQESGKNPEWSSKIPKDAVFFEGSKLLDKIIPPK